MGTIHKLPQHLINRLKAGEIVERPASVVKELIENSIDAGATTFSIEIEKGGKQLIKVTDNGTGITEDDLLLTIERYATSKITNEKDLHTILSYGFRGEALATISEVSGFRIQSKHASCMTGHELYKDGKHFSLKPIPFSQEHGTIVYVRDIFYAIPAREKFLKSDATERGYIKNICLDYALAHRDKQRLLSHNGKQIFSLSPCASLLERVIDLTKKERQTKLKPLEVKDDKLHLYGLAGDASLHFPKGDWIHMFVNGRPVEDRLLKKAIMDAYQRQIVPGTYPFVLLFIHIDPGLVDVNVHPRKQQVKFLDPGSIFTRVKQALQDGIGASKVNYAAFTKPEVKEYTIPYMRSRDGLSDTSMAGLKSMNNEYGQGQQQNLDLGYTSLLTSNYTGEQTKKLVIDNEFVQIIGQIRDAYIILQGTDHIYRVDQHALAERITFEKMRKHVKAHGFETEIVLQPLSVTFPKTVDIEMIMEQLNRIGFDVSLFGEGKIILHAVPKVFVIYKVDIELVMNFIWGLEEVGDETGTENTFFDILLDEILGMKACKASIKAGQKLGILEMQQLIQDALDNIDGLFVCQHGRPSIVALPRSTIDNLFDR